MPEVGDAGNTQRGHALAVPDQSIALGQLLEVGAYWKQRIVLTAVGLDLFTLLSHGARSAPQVARHHKGNAAAFTLFLNALTALGLLEKRGARFANSSFAEERLVQGKPEYQGDQLIVDDAYWELWGRLREALMSGQSPLASPLFHGDPPMAERLVRGLHHDALHTAPGLARRLSLRGRRRLLDLGGGAGTFSIAFCQRYPGLQATVFDLPTTTRVTRQVVEEWGMEDRIQVVDGDFRTDPIPGVYDVAFLSHILHGQGPRENRRLLQKVHGCLSPGGRLIVRDVIMGEELTQPEWGAVFAVNMLLHTGQGRCYSFSEISGWLRESGFAQVREVEPHELLTARKAQGHSIIAR